MREPQLGKLEKIEDLRRYWNNEAQDFTPWLAEPQNIRLLGEVIGLELDVEGQEQAVGPFSADILCKDATTGGWVVIENQLEPTNHKHLGQLLTYAAGLDVTAIVWIAERFTNEHRAALDWLNRITDDQFAFFGIEVELWKIGDSLAAPRFNLISKPNDWSRQVKGVANASRSDVKKLQLAFWSGYREYLLRNSNISTQAPAAKSFIHHPVALMKCHIHSVASTWNAQENKYGGELRVELWLTGDLAKQQLAALQAEKTQIEKEVGEPLIWYNPADKKICRIYVRRTVELTAENQWPDFYQWLHHRVEVMQRVFAPRLKVLASGNKAPVDEEEE
jgi:hypothetical protein